MKSSKVQPSESVASEHSHQQSRSEESGEAARLEGKCAVIVEDEGIIQMQLRRSLTRLGLKVVGAAMTGTQAIEVCLRERPDIILMDINMPGKIDGLEAARRILANYRACIVMLTAYVDYEEEAENIGVCGYIVKPVDNKMLRFYLIQAYARFQAFP